MIFFGYKSRFSTITRGLSAIAIGLVLIIGSTRGSAGGAAELIVKVIAAFLMAAGIVTFAHGYAHRSEGALNLMAVNAIADIGIGVLLFFFPGLVAGFLITAIGVLLVCFAGLQLIVMAGAMSLVGAGFTSLILSTLALIGGGMLIFSNFGKDVLSWIAGVCLICYGAQELYQTWKLRGAAEAYEIRRAQQAQTAKIDKQALENAKEVEYRKTDEPFTSQNEPEAQ